MSDAAALGAVLEPFRDGPVATDCDVCHADILYGETCYQIPTGDTWQGLPGDGDNGKPCVRIVCAGCHGRGER